MSKRKKIELIKDLLAGRIDRKGNCLIHGQVFIDNGSGQLTDTSTGRTVSKEQLTNNNQTIFIIPDNGRD